MHTVRRSEGRFEPTRSVSSGEPLAQEGPDPGMHGFDRRLPTEGQEDSLPLVHGSYFVPAPSDSMLSSIIDSDANASPGAADSMSESESGDTQPARSYGHMETVQEATLRRQQAQHAAYLDRKTAERTEREQQEAAAKAVRAQEKTLSEQADQRIALLAKEADALMQRAEALQVKASEQHLVTRDGATSADERERKLWYQNTAKEAMDKAVKAQQVLSLARTHLMPDLMADVGLTTPAPVLNKKDAAGPSDRGKRPAQTVVPAPGIRWVNSEDLKVLRIRHTTAKDRLRAAKMQLADAMQLEDDPHGLLAMA